MRPPIVPPLTARAQLWILAGAAILLLLCGTTDLPLIDRDEPRFAQATREMMARHDWLVPTFNGEYRFDKPPLTYWAMALFYAVGGVSELAARLHSIVSTVALTLLIYAMGRRWFSAITGFAAAFGFVTCLQVLLHGRLAVADMPMVLAVAAAQFALFELLCGTEGEATNPKSKRWFWTLYLALAAGFLAKGPIALAVPLGTALLHRFVLWRKPLPWARLRIGRGLLLVLAIVGVWGIPGLVETHGLWWKVGMGEHVVARGLEPLNSRHFFAPFYLVTALFSLFPWIALAGYGVLVLRRNWNERNAFLLSWLIAPYLIFLFYATQLPHYVLPAFPAFFLILGQALGLQAPLPRWPRSIAWVILGFWGVVVLALVVVIVGAPWAAPFASLRLALIGLAAILGGLVLLGVFFEIDRIPAMRGAVVLVAIGFLILGTSLRPLEPAIEVAKLAEGMPPETRFVAYGFTEGSLIFYMDRHWELVSSQNELGAELMRPGPAVIVQLDQEIKIGPTFQWLWGRLTGHAVPLKTDEYTTVVKTESPSVISGINFARASWETITVEIER